MATLGQSTLTSRMLRLVDEYIAQGGAVPVHPRAVAKWAISNGKWDRKRQAVELICAKDISCALRQDFYIDDQGRKVRSHHSIRVKTEVAGKCVQQTFWDDHRTMSHEFATKSFQQRRQQIVGDCRQLKLDVDSFNDRNFEKPRIQLVLNFTYDVAEELGTCERQPPRKG